MALLTAEGLRALAREALGEAGARGFVRFLPEGNEALLLTDAPRLLPDDAARERLLSALTARGFSPLPEAGGLLPLLPGDALLLRMVEKAPVPAWDWDGPLSGAFSLADRWLRAPDAPFSPDMPLSIEGRHLAVETTRLLWRDRAEALAGLPRLRALGAEAQRSRAGGLRLAGGILLSWCKRAAGTDGDPNGYAKNEEETEK